MEIVNAYEVLTDPQKRLVYDTQGEEALQKPNQQQAPTGPDAHADIFVHLEDLYSGVVKEYTITKNIICPHCRGTGKLNLACYERSRVDLFDCLLEGGAVQL